jgi:hypothetical protein
MGYYDPPEPDWVGPMEVKCSLTDVERKVITPSMQTHLKHLFDPLGSVADPWKATRTPEMVEQMRQRILARAIEELRREIGFAEELTFSCTFEGEAEVCIDRGQACWTCPVCGEEHQDSAEAFTEDPDPDRYYEQLRDERMGLA